MRITIAQINTTVGDITENALKISDCIAKAKILGSDIIVFPELAVTGYPPEDLLLKEHFVDDNLKALTKIKNSTEGIMAIVGYVDKDEKSNFYNAAAVIRDKKIIYSYHKKALPNYSVFDEKRYFSQQKENCVFDFGGETTFGISICEDIWEDEGPHLDQASKGARLLINIAASPYNIGKRAQREKLVEGICKKTGAYLVYVNAIGGQDELVFDGGSFLTDPKGKVIASCHEFQEDFLTFDLNIRKTAKKSNKSKITTIKIKDVPQKQKINIPPVVTKKMNKIEGIYDALLLGIHDYVKKNGFRKIVLGLSGGIDSALVAVLAAKALGRENVVCVSMPSMFSSNETKDDAVKLANNIGSKFRFVPITRIFKVFKKTLEDSFGATTQGITDENLQARIRGNILMAYSNKYGWLVLITGNKSEAAVGYSTLYGDMAGGFAPIKDLPKTLVYELAEYINKKEKTELIPKSIIQRAPTAELSPGQKDTDSLPPYSDLDPIIEAYVEGDASLKQVRKKYGQKEVDRIITMIDKSEHKRRQSPPGIRVTTKAFGKDRRMPITNRYKESK
ncbi:MAG: NAD+ synthase [Candidatus Omnitrophica bacterium]|nr:NAD+ synthase [Candidatus Omnitrophota bacterium]